MSQNFVVSKKSIETVYVLEMLLSSAPTLHKVLEISSEDLQKYERAACRLLEKKEYDCAADAFFFLTTLDPCCDRYWLNFGLAEQKRKNYDEALKGFGVCAFLNMSDPSPHVYAAECYVARNKLNLAIDSLRLATECKVSENPELKKRIFHLTNIIKKERVKK